MFGMGVNTYTGNHSNIEELHEYYQQYHQGAQQAKKEQSCYTQNGEPSL